MGRMTRTFSTPSNPAHIKPAKEAQRIAELGVDLDALVAAVNASRTYFQPIPLATLRETTNMDVGAVAANGGLLASDTTPILEAINAATDGCQRVAWAAANVDQVMFQVPLPPDIDTTEDLEIHIRGLMAGATDTTTSMVSAAYFNEGDTAIADTGATDFAATVGEVVITIAAADIPTGAQTLSVGLTPEAHANDALYVTGIWLEGVLT